MNRVSLVGHLTDAPSHAAAVGERPAPTAFSIDVPRRGSSAVDWIGVTAIAAQAVAVAGAGLHAGAAGAVESYLHTTSPAGDGRYQLEVVATHVQPLAPARTPNRQEATPMTIEALSRLIELLTDTADYAAGVDRSAIAADLTRAADAAQLLLADERASTRRARRTRRAAVAA